MTVQEGRSRRPKYVIAGTAGHIDHGKTALVRALTGIDTDRLEEEKRRGITIDIGFAHLELDSGVLLGFVDVPGHERFVKNMLAGAGGIDLALLAVAADESVMPQTREHFEICRLLGVRRGLVALTKIDRAEPDLVELAKLEVAEYLKGSFLEGAPIVPVSAKTGAGLDELRRALDEAAAGVEARDPEGRLRLPVDRVFVMKGFGTIVTGTLVSGRIAADQEVEILPGRKRARVRGLQVHNRPAREAQAGQRTAVNLSAVDAGDLARGQVLAPPGVFEPAQRFDGRLDLLDSAEALKSGAPVHFHIGADECVARVSFLDGRERLAPGDSAYARLRLSKPALVVPGDRFVVRRFSPVTTIGGGEALDNDPPRRRPRAERLRRVEAFASRAPERVLEALLEDARFGLTPQAVYARTGWTAATLEAAARHVEGSQKAVRLAGGRLLHSRHAQHAGDQITGFLKAFHRREPLAAGARKEEVRSRLFPAAPEGFFESLLEELARRGEAAVEGELLRLPSHRVVYEKDEAEARETMLQAFAAAGLEAPALRDLLGQVSIDRTRARKIVQTLFRERLVVKISEDLVVHREAVEELKRSLAERKSRNARITVPEFKELAGVSRKYAIPLLEFLDREKVTRRVGDARVIL